MLSTPSSKPWFKDWTYYLCPGPRRRFTAEEMARGGQQRWPPGIDQYVSVSTGLVVLQGGLFQWRAALWVVAALGVLGCTLLGLWVARKLWRNPTRLRLNLSSLFAGLAFLATMISVDQFGNFSRPERIGIALSFGLAFVMMASAWWFLAMYREQQIESRLAELDALDEQLRLQRRLATAQIHPHFVFNTLASLTHWVETQDARAAPLLREFNAYLRATLPMFERESQPLREELELVRHYLAIMQARLGERLHWQIDCDAEPALQLPPGSLLTLVENAITHGIEPSLRGGKVTVRCMRESGRLLIEVEDSGEGLQQPVTEGLGLSNTRERLLTLYPGAQLRLNPNLEGGCTAQMEIPA
jgi:signal transduction histidine kinase